MTSEIRTNTITSRAGLSTVTFTDSGPMFSGITTFVDNSTFSVGTGGTIHAPATNTLNIGVNNTESLRIDSNSNLKVAGIVTATTFYGSGANLTSLPAQATIANNADNRIITGGSGVNLNGEAGLTYDGTTLSNDAVTRNIKSGANYVLIGSSNAGGVSLGLDGDSNGDGSGTDYAFFEHDTSGNLNIVGDNPANAANIIFKTNSATERLRISSGGTLVIGDSASASPAGKLHLYQASNDPYMYIQRGSGDSATTIGGIFFKNSTNNLALIDVASSDINDGYMKFSTMGAGTLTERLRITSDGIITAQKSATFGNTSDSFTSVQITSSTTGISELRFADTTANPGYLKYTHSSDTMEFVVGTNNQLYLYGSSREARFSGYLVAQSAGSGGSATASFQATQSGMSASSYNYILSGSNDGGNKCVMFVNGSSRSADGGTNTLTLRNDAGNLRLGNSGTNTNILGNVNIEQYIANQETTFRYDNGGGMGAYLSIQNRGSGANTATGIAFGCGNSDASMTSSDYGEAQIKVTTDSGLYGNMEFNLHTGANRSFMKIVGNGQGNSGAGSGSEGMRGGVAFGNAGVALDRSWTGQPGIHVFNQNVEGDTDQGTFRFHGWDRSYASYPDSSGSDFGVVLVADGMTLTSDRRRKTDITTITGALNTVSQMRGVSFTYVNRELKPQTHMSMDNGKKLGFIAQEVIPLLPELILDSGEKAVELENGYCDRYNMDYGGVTPLLVEAIKELKTKIETLEQDNIALRARVTNLEGN